MSDVITDYVVDAACRGAWAYWDTLGSKSRDAKRKQITAALTAALASLKGGVAVPDGWQMVPKEPTKDMVQAAIWALDRWREKNGNVQGFVPPSDKYQIRYRAMLASAPSCEAS